MGDKRHSGKGLGERAGESYPTHLYSDGGFFHLGEAHSAPIFTQGEAKDSQLGHGSPQCGICPGPGGSKNVGGASVLEGVGHRISQHGLVFV